MRLTLNANKTEVIPLGSKCNFQGIHVDGSLVVPTNKVRSLGVILDDELTMEAHVMKVRAAAFSRLRLITRVRKSLRPNLCAFLVKSLVVSNALYCASLLTCVGATLLGKLQQIINSSIRLTHGMKKSTNIDTIARSEGWLPMEMIIKLRLLSLFFTVLKYGKALFLHTLIAQYHQQRQLRSQEQQLLNVPRVNLTSMDQNYGILYHYP